MMNKKLVITSIIFPLFLLSSCANSTELDEAKSVFKNINDNYQSVYEGNELNLFTRKYFRKSNSLETNVITIYDQNNYFCKETTRTNNGVLTEKYDYKKEDDNGIFLISFTSENNKIKEQTIKKTYYSSINSFETSWNNVYKEKAVKLCLNDLESSLSKIDNIFNLCEENNANNVSIFSNSSSSLEISAIYDKVETINKIDTTYKINEHVVISNYLPLSYELNKDSSDNTYIAYNYTKAMLDYPL